MERASVRPVSFAEMKEYQDYESRSQIGKLGADHPFGKSFHKEPESGGISAHKSTWRMCAGFLCANAYLICPPRVCCSEELMNCCCMAQDCSFPSGCLPTAPAHCNVRILGIIPVPCCVARITKIRDDSGNMGLCRVCLGCVNPFGDEYMCCPRQDDLEPDVVHQGKKENFRVCFGCCIPGILTWNCYCLRPCKSDGCHTFCGSEGCIALGCLGCDGSLPCSHAIPSTFGCFGFVTKYFFCAKAGAVATRVDL